MANLYPGRWSRDLLKRLGYTPTEHNITALLAWQYAEGGHTNGARWNPLNTTQPMPGAGNTGTQGNIKVYRDYEQGMDATVKTLRNGKYDKVLAALKDGRSAKAVADAVTASPWGTTALFQQCLSRGRETAKKHPSLWEKGSSSSKPGEKPGKKPGTGKQPARKGRPSASRGTGKVSLDLDELTGVIRTLDKGAGDADTTVRRVGTSVRSLETLLVTQSHVRLPAATPMPPDLLARVRTTVEPLVDPKGALLAVPRHLRWESDLVGQVRWAAQVADGGGSKTDKKKVDQLIALLAKGGKVGAGTRMALEMLLKGQLKVGGAAPGKGGSKGGAKGGSGTPSKGGSKPSTKTGGVGRKALAIAKKEIGVKEVSTDYSKRIGEYQKTTGAMRQAWCASFVNWSLRKAGKTVDSGALAGVATWVGLARQKKAGLRFVSAAEARPGDIVAYDWGGGTDFGQDGHIGLVSSSVKGGRFTAVEGNTMSPGQVAQRSRSTSMGNVVFIRVA